MTRPQSLKTKIFLDGGDPKETKEIIGLLGFLDGQTTNPTLISKNPYAQKRAEDGKKFSREEIFDFYRRVVEDISGLIPEGSVSIEVYADGKTASAEMLKQGEEMFRWIPNAHVKFPITKEGLAAAEAGVRAGMRVNMTLCFSEEQAAAVYAATKKAKRGQVFISPFVGRLDDRGENGMELIKNILRMYENGDGHVETLAASIRNMNHFLYAIKLGADIITAPFKILKEWGERGLPVPDDGFVYPVGGLREVSYREIDLHRDWRKFDISHELTASGIDRFAEDWNALIAKI